MKHAFSGIAAVLLVALLLGAIAEPTLATQRYQSGQGSQIFIQSTTVSSSELVVGHSGTLDIRVTNNGTTSETVSVALIVSGPDNQTDAYELDRPTLGPGATTTITKQLNASTPGTHHLRVQLLDPDTAATYDTSRDITVTVLESPPARLGGPIDKTEIALGALVAALLGMGVLGWRQFR
ncbi:MAG: CARDB domain-containing protein [Haloferacaceae archaeon]